MRTTSRQAFRKSPTLSPFLTTTLRLWPLPSQKLNVISSDSFLMICDTGAVKR